MKRIGFALLTLFAATAFARPVVIEPVATLPAPPGGYTRYGGDVAIDGDYALITAFRPDPVDPANGEVVAGLTTGSCSRPATPCSPRGSSES
jgi:hypothetical protein